MSEMSLLFSLLAAIFALLTFLVALLVPYYNPHLTPRYDREELRRKHPRLNLEKAQEHYLSLPSKKKVKVWNKWMNIPWYKQLDLKMIVLVSLSLTTFVFAVLSLPLC